MPDKIPELSAWGDVRDGCGGPGAAARVLPAGSAVDEGRALSRGPWNRWERPPSR